MFGTPVDDQTVAARIAPETPLRFLPADSSNRSQAVLATPRIWPPLDMGLIRPFAKFFDGWIDSAGWWRTVRPAVFSIDKVGNEVWAARIIEPGALVRVSDDLAFEPPLSLSTFAVTSPATPTQIELVPGEPVLYESPAMRIHMMRSRGSANRFWARTFVEGEDRQARRAMLVQELDALRELHAHTLAPFNREPTTDPSVAVVLVADAAEGLAPSAILNQAPANRRGEILRLCEQLFHLAGETVHRSKRCLGPVVLDCIRLRWLPAVSFDRPGGAVLTLPGAGRAGNGLPPSAIDLFPDSSRALIESQFGERYVRSKKNDLEGIRAMMALARDVYGVD